MIFIYKKSNIRTALKDSWPNFRIACAGMGINIRLLDQVKTAVQNQRENSNPSRDYTVDQIASLIQIMKENERDFEKFLIATEIAYSIYVLGQR